MDMTTDSTGSELSGIAGWAVHVMETMGSPGAGIAIALENLFPPLPSEVILPLAGFTASRGEFGLAEALLWTTAGSIAGALVLYGLGALLGRDRTRRIVARMPLMRVSDVDKAEAWFDRHGTKAVFFGRMIPLFRSLISIPAGIERMNLVRFTTLTAAGSLIWNSIFVLAGYFLGENWDAVQLYADVLQKFVILAVLVALTIFVVRRVRGARRGRHARIGG